MTRSPRLGYSSRILDLTFRLPNSILADEDELTGTAIKYKEEEEENTTTKYTSQQCNKRVFDMMSFRPNERMGAEEDEDEELIKRRKNFPKMVASQHRLRGKTEVGFRMIFQLSNLSLGVIMIIPPIVLIVVIKGDDLDGETERTFGGNQRRTPRPAS